MRTALCGLACLLASGCGLASSAQGLFVYNANEGSTVVRVESGGNGVSYSLGARQGGKVWEGHSAGLQVQMLDSACNVVSETGVAVGAIDMVVILSSHGANVSPKGYPDSLLSSSPLPQATIC